jgi:hypothetical protein
MMHGLTNLKIKVVIMGDFSYELVEKAYWNSTGNDSYRIFIHQNPFFLSFATSHLVPFLLYSSQDPFVSFTW